MIRSEGRQRQRVDSLRRDKLRSAASAAPLESLGGDYVHRHNMEMGSERLLSALHKHHPRIMQSLGAA